MQERQRIAVIDTVLTFICIIQEFSPMEILFLSSSSQHFRKILVFHLVFHKCSEFLLVSPVIPQTLCFLQTPTQMGTCKTTLLSHFMRKISADRFSPKFHKLNNPSVSSQRGDYCYYPLCNSLPCPRGSFMKSVSTHCLYRDEAKLMVSSMSTPCRIHHVRAVCWFKGCCRTCYRLVLLNTCTLELPRSL